MNLIREKNTLVFVFVTLLQVVFTQRRVGDSCIVDLDKQPGVCQLVTECIVAKQQYDRYKVRPTRCGFQGSTLIVCCSTSQQPPQPLNNNRPNINYNSNQSSRKRISEEKCEKYSQSVTFTVSALPLLIDAEPIQNRVEHCEYGSTELIYGGEPVKHGEFPHMAAIGWEIEGGRGYDWNCGGTLISENFVMTAGHCLYIDNSELANGGEPAIVRLGEFNLNSNNDGANPQDIRIETIIPHPDYKPPRKYNDIALLKLATPASLEKYVRPACLWTKSNIEDRNAIATGWGFTEGGVKSSVLQRVTLDIYDQTLCIRIFGNGGKRSLPNSIVNSQFCAGYAKGGKDTCQGDSGGPLQVQSKINKCVYNVIGLTSFGKKCGDANSGGVYTKISSYIDWIEGIVWPNGK